MSASCCSGARERLDGSSPDSVKRSDMLTGCGVIRNGIGKLLQRNVRTVFGLHEPWHVTKGAFNLQDRAAHVRREGRKTAKYSCPECGKACVRQDGEKDGRIRRHGDVLPYPCVAHSGRPGANCPKRWIHATEPPCLAPATDQLKEARSSCSSFEIFGAPSCSGHINLDFAEAEYPGSRP